MNVSNKDRYSSRGYSKVLTRKSNTPVVARQPHTTSGRQTYAALQGSSSYSSSSSRIKSDKNVKGLTNGLDRQNHPATQGRSSYASSVHSNDNRRLKERTARQNSVRPESSYASSIRTNDDKKLKGFSAMYVVSEVSPIAMTVGYAVLGAAAGYYWGKNQGTPEQSSLSKPLPEDQEEHPEPSSLELFPEVQEYADWLFPSYERQ